MKCKNLNLNQKSKLAYSLLNDKKGRRFLSHSNLCLVINMM